MAYYIDRGALEKDKGFVGVYDVPLIAYRTRYLMNSFKKGILELRYKINCSLQRSDFSNVEVFLNYRKGCAYKYSVHKMDMSFDFGLNQLGNTAYKK